MSVRLLRIVCPGATAAGVASTLLIEAIEEEPLLAAEEIAPAPSAPLDRLDVTSFRAKTRVSAKTTAVRTARGFGATVDGNGRWAAGKNAFSRPAYRGKTTGAIVFGAHEDGRCSQLPVDAWYPELKLVVEVAERQHDEAVPLFDRRQTVSGVARGKQRRIYDRRRVEVLPQQDIRLIALDVKSFPTRARKLARDTGTDEAVVRATLAEFLLAGVSP